MGVRTVVGVHGGVFPDRTAWHFPSPPARARIEAQEDKCGGGRGAGVRGANGWPNDPDAPVLLACCDNKSCLQKH